MSTSRIQDYIISEDGIPAISGENLPRTPDKFGHSAETSSELVTTTLQLRRDMSSFLSAATLRQQAEGWPMLDNLTLSPENGTALGTKAVSYAEPVFAGHFPGQPILPGVLQAAAMSQASLLLAQTMFPHQGRLDLVGFQRLKFRKPVLPGHLLQVRSEFQQEREDGTLTFSCSVSHADGIASNALVLLASKPESWFIPQPPSQEPSPLAPFLHGHLCTPADLEKILPHRRPFLLLDGIYDLEQAQEQATGIHNLSSDDPILQNSPEAAFPPFLLPEAAAQLGCALVLNQPQNRGKLGLFLAIDQAVFRARAFAGEQLQLQLCCQMGDKAGCAEAIACSNSRILAEISLKFLLVDKL